MALRDVPFLVAHDDLAGEDLLVGRPVLSHMGIHSTTMLERLWCNTRGEPRRRIERSEDEWSGSTPK